MKKILSVFLAILVMVTSCVCALTVFAADEPCKDHVVTVWANNNTKNEMNSTNTKNASNSTNSTGTKNASNSTNSTGSKNASNMSSSTKSYK